MVFVGHWCLVCALDRNLFATFFPLGRMESLGRDDLFCFLMDLIWWSGGHCCNHNTRNNNKTLSQEMLCAAFTLLAVTYFGRFIEYSFFFFAFDLFLLSHDPNNKFDSTFNSNRNEHASDWILRVRIVNYGAISLSHSFSLQFSRAYHFLANFVHL